MRFKLHDSRLTTARRFPLSFAKVGRGTPCPPSGQSEAKTDRPGGQFPLSLSRNCGTRFRFPLSQSGVALVITLILLAVTLVMAVAFLAISRRERGSVSTETDTASAKFAADAALAHAEAQIVSDMLGDTNFDPNPYISRLYVSTNYINAAGFTNGSADLANVNYDTLQQNGGPLSPAQLQQNIANLYYSPRAPVYVSTNGPTNEFRFYLDLNRNGRFDTNGTVTNLDNNLRGLGTVSAQIGDPEWIGVLEHPDAPHGPNNRFIARYCFIAVPADSLDFNYIHNQAFDANIGGTVNANSRGANGQDSYSRDQGVGTWEINLGAFLADLDTNRWDPTLQNPVNPLAEPYLYPEGADGNSIAFDDARALIAWRYNNQYQLLNNFNNTFANVALNYPSNIDLYGLGAQFTFDTNFQSYYVASFPGGPALPFSGSTITNNFFDLPSELFNTNQAFTSTRGGATTIGYNQFATNLLRTGMLPSTYDRYAYYRMLGQIGTDTRPESGKINLNFQNAIVNYLDVNAAGMTIGIPTAITVVPGMETNLITWQPQDFFLAAADQLLRNYTTYWFESSPSNYMQTYYGLVTNYNAVSAIGLTNFPTFGLTNQIPSFGVSTIPVYYNGRFVYTPAVNRLLQLAANIYDASTNKMTTVGTGYFSGGSTVGVSNYPSVFRPVFWVTNEFSLALNQNFTNVYIKSYAYTAYATNGINDTMFTYPVEVTSLPQGLSFTNVWGVPWILGAKKGMPSFDKIEIENSFFVERELQFNRNSSNVDTTAGDYFPYGRTYTTNQMFIMGVSNYFGIIDANTYAESYNYAVSVVARNNLQMGLAWTNENGQGNFAVNSVAAWATNNFVPWAGSTADMLLGTNLFPYYLTAGAGTAPVATNIYNRSVPFLLNTANLNWVNSASFVYYDTPVSITFPSDPADSFTGPCFIPTFLDPSNYLDSGINQMPQMYLSMTNRAQVFIVDSQGGILDYVQLGGMNGTVNINTNVADNSQYAINPTGNPDVYSEGLWSTNLYSGNTPYGVYEQFLVSQSGNPPAPPDADGGLWGNNPIPGAGSDVSQAAQQAYFNAFFSASDEAPYSGVTSGYLTNISLSMQAPFTPVRVSTQRFIYEANDPLVHYLTSDLNDPSSSSNSLVKDVPILSKLSSPNDRYAPWGTVASSWPGAAFFDHNGYNLSYKDPAVYNPDNWDFPQYKYPTVGWLGRVHRGTPWQTVYLKSTNLLQLANAINNGPTVPSGVNTWQLWTGNPNPFDATNSAPIQDRLLFDLFTAAPNQNASRGRLSINIGASDPNNLQAGLASWSALLSGVIVISNDMADTTLETLHTNQAESPLANEQWPVSDSFNIQPAGLLGQNTAMGQLVQSINTTRATRTNFDGLTNVFEHVGEILSVSALSDGSPFLNTTNDSPPFLSGVHVYQLQNGISDEMYEWIPQNIMGLLNVSGTPQSPPRYVVYCYGQTLKPAANGIVSSGALFNLVTNYQITAEFGSRAVIRIDNPPSPENPTATPHVVVEQYNPLPPD